MWEKDLGTFLRMDLHTQLGEHPSKVGRQFAACSEDELWKVNLQPDEIDELFEPYGSCGESKSGKSMATAVKMLFINGFGVYPYS